MDLKEIKLRVKGIEEIKDDDEAAHSTEDGLYEDFVRYIAETGNEKQKKMAKAVLQTCEIDFARWCA